MAARHAESQVHPRVADPQAIFAAIGARCDFADLIEMCALVRHETLYSFCLLPTAFCSDALPHGRATDTALLMFSAFCLLPSAFCTSLAHGRATSAADSHPSYPANPVAAG